jgi:hypothetical protein
VLPSTLPALPLSLQQLVLTVHANPQDSGLWGCLSHLLREPTLSLVEITVAFDGGAMTLLDNMGDFSWHHLLSPPCGLDLSNDHDVLIRGKMMLYALEFRKRGISIVDEYGSVWPADADSGQWYPSYVDVVLMMSQDSSFPNGTYHDLSALVLN